MGIYPVGCEHYVSLDIGMCTPYEVVPGQNAPQGSWARFSHNSCKYYECRIDDWIQCPGGKLDLPRELRARFTTTMSAGLILSLPVTLSTLVNAPTREFEKVYYECSIDWHWIQWPGARMLPRELRRCTMSAGLILNPVTGGKCSPGSWEGVLWVQDWYWIQ